MATWELDEKKVWGILIDLKKRMTEAENTIKQLNKDVKSLREKQVITVGERLVR